ncbi:MAG: hypothetical protein Ta2B_08910 [Termitinemataceae bacterium]|nr:MAG: hypothetical protein Ta2B_08910 [Termitinemataceae bacterium]
MKKKKKMLAKNNLSLIYLSCCFVSCILVTSCTVDEAPPPSILSGRVLLMDGYTNYKVEKIHVYSRNGTKLFGSAVPYEVETASGAKEIHWKKPIPAADGEECTFWVQISTPIYKRLYFNQGTDDIIIEGAQYDLPVDKAQMPIFTTADLRRIGSDAALFPMTEQYVLIRDIALSEDEDWEPFGTNANNAFAGTFDGNYRTVSGLTLAAGSREYVGFFGFVKRAYIKNLFLIISDKILTLTTTTNQNIGILAAYAEDSIIENITVRGGLQGLNIEKSGGASFSLGGIVGTFKSSRHTSNTPPFLPPNSVISGCACEINIAINKKDGEKSDHDKSAYGGIVGLLFRDNSEGSFLIEKCYSSETISASAESTIFGGGIVGFVDAQTDSSTDFLSISECYNSGNISGEAAKVYCGGIFGSISGGSNDVKISMEKIVSINANITLSASDTNGYGIGKITGGHKYTPKIDSSTTVYSLGTMILNPYPPAPPPPPGRDKWEFSIGFAACGIMVCKHGF